MSAVEAKVQSAQYVDFWNEILVPKYHSLDFTPPQPHIAAAPVAYCSTAAHIQQTLEREGISFIADPGGGIGVRLEKKPQRG